MPRMKTACILGICSGAHTALNVHTTKCITQLQWLSDSQRVWQAPGGSGAGWGACVLQLQINAGSSYTRAKCPMCIRPQTHSYIYGPLGCIKAFHLVWINCQRASTDKWIDTHNTWYVHCGVCWQLVYNTLWCHAQWIQLHIELCIDTMHRCDCAFKD